jgi:hypothetical protein
MTIKYLGTLTKIATSTQTSDTTKVSNVYVNPSFSYQNPQITQALAKQTITVLPEVKSIIRLVDTAADSERIADVSLAPAARTTVPVVPVPIASAPLPPPVVQAVLIPAPSEESPTSGYNIIPFFFPTTTVPETASPTPPPRSITPISAESSLAPGEAEIFGLISFIDFPINVEIAEKTTGLELTKFEKPRVLAIVNDDIRNGTPNQNLVLFKKLTSNRARITKYTILRKEVFKDREFKKALELQSDQLSVLDKHKHFVAATGHDPKDVFIYIDKEVKPNNTYVYKIEVSWVSTGAAPKTQGVGISTPLVFINQNLIPE